MTFTFTPRVGGEYVWECCHCGRTWSFPGGHATGFVAAGAHRHVDHCKHRSPAQRRAVNKKDEARWKRKRARSLLGNNNAHIENNPNHPGLQEPLT